MRNANESTAKVIVNAKDNLVQTTIFFYQIWRHTDARMHVPARKSINAIYVCIQKW